MNNPPCKNCITYAICKNSYNDSPEFSVLLLLHKCSILHDYFQQHKGHVTVNMKGKAFIQTPVTDQICQTFNWKQIQISDMIGDTD